MHARHRRSERRFARQALAYLRRRFNPYACGATGLAVLTLAFTLSGGGRAWTQPERPKIYCALAFPPSQVISTPLLEAVYCQRVIDGQCHAAFGWIVVSEPVRCE